MDSNKNCDGCFGASFCDCDRCERMKTAKSTDNLSKSENNKTTNTKECKNE